MFRFFLSVISFFAFSILPAAESVSLSAKGYLGASQVETLLKELEEGKRGLEQIYLEVDSTSGDIQEVFKLAQAISALQAEQGVKVKVFLQENAIGPAGLLLFLADHIEGSLFLAWGDLPSNSGTVLPTNLLRSRVEGLINPNSTHQGTMKLLAVAMTDPSTRVTDDGGWKLYSGEEDPSGRVLSPEGETLVLNRNQMVSLGLTSNPVSAADFWSAAGLQGEELQEVLENKSREDPLARDSQTLDALLAQYIPYDEDGQNLVGYIYVGGHEEGIDQATWIYIKSALDEFKKTKPRFILLELNTPGGEVFASQKIADALVEMDEVEGIPTVAVINDWAISAGAMLAFSCRFVAVASDGSMGAAMPVLGGGQEPPKDVGEKINSALRADFANRANTYDRSPLLAEAMVDNDMILVYRNGNIVQLDDIADLRKDGLHPDVLITEKDKLLTLRAADMLRYGMADFQLEKGVAVKEPTEAEKADGSWPAKKNILFASPYFKDIPNAIIKEHKLDWRTSVFAFLAEPAVASLLFLVMMLGFYMEINTPGFGLPGGLALFCLFLIVISSLSVEASAWLELMLMAAGLLLVLVELFVIPGFGLTGILGVLLFLFGLLALMLPGLELVKYNIDEGTLNAAGEVVLERLMWLSATFVIGVICICILARFLVPNMSRFSKLVLVGAEEDASEGYVSGLDPSTLPQAGAKGESFSPLRPSGKILVNNEVFDAMSSGKFIEKGKEVIVLRLDGSRIIVEEVAS